MAGESSRFERYLTSRKRRTESTLERVLPAEKDAGPARTVASAMRYAALGSGKRLRAVLTHAAFEACGGRGDGADFAGAAMELIHAYSLVHDDLPALDDDDLRRGQPTVHRAYGEAAAILCGDALLALAFEVLATRPPGHLYAARRLESVRVAARGAGLGGLVGGQIADLEADGSRTDAERLDWIHRRKTGALFSACAEIGAVCADAASEVRLALARFGETLGLAFQITDDLLDDPSSEESQGAPPEKDAASGRATYPAVHGARESKRLAKRLLSGSLVELSGSGLATERLEELGARAIRRES